MSMRAATPANAERISVRSENVPIDVLRALAALVVVLSHVRTLVMADFDDVVHSPLQTVLYEFSALGHSAVVVFFVLSGYWVGGSVIRGVKRNSFAWSGYLVNRITRLGMVLVPALVLTLVCDLIGRHYFGEMSTYRGDPGYRGVVAPEQGPIDAWSFLGNAVFLMNIRVPTYGSNTALWSLSFEFWMYVLGPLVIVAFQFRVGLKWSVMYLLLAGAIALFIGPRALGYVPLWALGAAVAAVAPRIAGHLNSWPVRRVVAARILTGGATLLASFGVRAMGSLSEMAVGIIVAIPAAAFIATLTTGMIGSGFLARSLTKFSTLAQSSYSLYAIHTPIAVLLVSALGVGVDERWPSDPLHWTFMVLIIAGIVALSWLFAQITERHTSTVRTFVMDRIRGRKNAK
jgi:peptidoglycan/LPS O-acetylase OafA/YrhL